MIQTLPIHMIATGDRHRVDMGDVAALAESIQRVGLLHPVVVTADHVLIAGGRRVEACKRLGWKSIPVNVAATINDARALLEAERDENTCRQDMKPSEKVALGRALEDLERPRAAARMNAGTQPCENFSQGSGKTGEIVGAAIGMSRPTYERAKLVVETSEDMTLPDDVRAVAVEARETMDRTGKVLPAHDRVAPLVGKKPAKGGTGPRGNGRREQPIDGTPSDRRIADLTRALTAVHATCTALANVDVPANLPVEIKERAHRELREAAAAVNRFRRQVEES